MWRTCRPPSPSGRCARRSVVVVELTGPSTGPSPSACRRRAAASRSSPGVHGALAMPSDVFVVLTCGRRDPTAVSGVTAEGDADLARRILGNLKRDDLASRAATAGPTAPRAARPPRGRAVASRTR